MKRWYKLTKYSLSIIMAVVISAAMMIPASADVLFNGYDYITKDSFGNIILSRDPLFIAPTSNTQITNINRLYYVAYSSDYDILLFTPTQYNDKFTYNVVQRENNDLQISFFRPSSYTVEYESVSAGTTNYWYFINSGSSGLPGNTFEFAVYIADGDDTQITLDNYKIYTNYQPLYNKNNLPSTNQLQNQTDIDTNFSLSDAFGNNGINIGSLTQVINNVINNQTSSIITYGNEYIQFLPVNEIQELANAEDQLSNAEDALQDKSKSLVQRASGGVQQAVTASGQLVSSLTSTVPTVVSFATDIIDQTPEEVQAAVLAVPLLSFAAWLIGLKK